MGSWTLRRGFTFAEFGGGGDFDGVAADEEVGSGFFRRGGLP